jgi:hypothetical protein
VFAVGNVAYEALAKLLLHLGAGPGGHTHVVVTDVREELVVYVNGEQRAGPAAVALSATVNVQHSCTQ